MIETQAAAKDRLVFECCRRPGEGDAGIDVEDIRAAEFRSGGTEALWSGGCEVEGDSAVQHLVEAIVEGIANAEIEGEIGTEFPFVLCERQHLGLTQAIVRKLCRISCRTDLVRLKGWVGRESNSSVGRLRLVHLHGADLGSVLQSVPAFNPGEIVNIGVRIADTDLIFVAVQRSEAGDGDGIVYVKHTLIV